MEKRSPIKCYSVKLAELREITPKAYLAVCFDGRKAVIPKSQVFGIDMAAPEKSEAYWIAAWIVEKHRLQYSPKRFGWHERDRPERIIRQSVFRRVERIVPETLTPAAVEVDEELLR